MSFYDGKIEPLPTPTKTLTEQIVHIQNDLDVVFAEVVKLEKKLEIATEALKKYQEAINHFKKDPMNNIIMLAHQLIYDIDTDSKQALTKMKGVE